MRLYHLFLLSILFLGLLWGFAFGSSVGGNVIVNNGLVSVSISPTQNSFIAGNTQLWTATVTPGTSPYSYTWNVYNWNGVLLSTVNYPSNSFTQNQFKYTFYYGQTYYANVVVVDNTIATTNTATSQNSVITVCYPTCSGVATSTSSPTLPPRQQELPNYNSFWLAVAGMGIVGGGMGLFAFAWRRNGGKKEKEV